MDGYPPGSLDPSVPFLIASGLVDLPTGRSSENQDEGSQGTTLTSEIPAVTGENAEVLHSYLASIDATQPPWSFGDKKRPPSSTLYPDGLINTDWLQKHQERVPSVYLCFYTLTSDQGRATLLDNQLKTDINAIKAEIAKSGYKTKLAVALMSETAPLPQSLTQSIQERLENIRKGTGLDTGRSIFYIAPRESPEELTQAADTILTALYPQSIEYYRDLGRHSRKKKGRGITPQPTIPHFRNLPNPFLIWLASESFVRKLRLLCEPTSRHTTGC
ncbi:unnamed protein product [Parascedosporium putredinis]|uniref:Uncharacterized protein n=1 Tax=Parascedosporium putredinis TaxID=1442378 RepID=A0A9P1H6J2_9PEZI|nr:unnamed protein product [Parascedosporium putredinis]CAI8000364.1 unnamed protein product [Parascedosporium putredinis]